MKKNAGSLLDSVETWLSVLAFVLMFGAIVIQVFYRYVLDSPLVWPFEFSIFCYIYVVYIGAVMAARRGTHVSFDLVYERFPERLKIIVSAATDAFVAVLFIALIPSSLGYIKMVGSVSSSALGIPWGAVLVVFPVSMAIVSLVLLGRALEALRHLSRQGVRG